MAVTGGKWAERFAISARLKMTLVRFSPYLRKSQAKSPFVWIPLNEKNLIFGRVQKCSESGETWIALNRDNQVVGFLVVVPHRVV